MNLQQLEYFKVIAEIENFTKASKELSVTQPALSKAISKLEEELKVSLFEKKGRNIKLTEYGEVFLTYSNKALIEIENGIKTIGNMLTEKNETIFISSTPRIGGYFMHLIISDFLNEYPNVKFQFNQQSAQEVINDLSIGNIDIGFYDSKDIDENKSEIESIPVKKQDYVLIVPKKHKFASRNEISLKELKDESFIAFCENSKEKLMSYTEILGYAPKISIQPDGANIGSAVEGLVSMGAGISIVPNTPMINSNTLSIINIKEDIKERTIYMGISKKSKISKVATKFKEYVISSANIK
ncbi:LysR family transcriptional regulator [Paraclostridium bifermentans]|uniref:LysR family transcriptional regulator n=1 Tax=Paraclostridium bifermentans TaxID=1490 RepID=UPI000A16DE52|nr:LysR family transcriptional regulator [Paraclostridium bifermentans]OSB12049.1 LysR family transcriptional regulator [Paraclostridium bifermentans]